MSVVHALYEVGRPEEHASKTLLDLGVADPYPFAEDQDLEIFPDSFPGLAPSQDQVVLNQEHIHLLPESPEIKGRIGKLLEIDNHPGPFGIAVDVPDTGQVVFIGVDDARSVAVTPQVSGASDVFVIPDSNSGVEILHGAMEIFLCGRGDDVVMVGHKHYVVDEKVIFFMGFLKYLEKDAGGLALMESEGSVVSPTDQVVG